MPKVYVAGPLGFSPATKGFHDAVLLPAVATVGWEPLDPWADPDGTIGARFGAAMALTGVAEREAALAAINTDLGAANEQLIRASHAVLAVLDGTDVDSGTAAEIGFAAGLGLPTVGLRLDLRLTGDNAGGLVNLQVEHFILTRGGTLHTTLDEAMEALRGLEPR